MLVISFLNELRMHSSIAIIFTRLNGFNYCYVTLIILFIINHLFADGDGIISIAIFNSILPIHLQTVKWFQVLLCITNNSINPLFRHC